MHLPTLSPLFVLATVVTCLPLLAQSLDLELSYQEPVADNSERFHRLSRAESWSPSATAVIVCDMWDSHHSVNAVRRVTEIAPRMNRFVHQLRRKGVTVIHAPSDCMSAYETHPARRRAQSVDRADTMPADIASWCDQIPSEEAAAYPLDQSAGGEDDDLLEHEQWARRLEALGRNPAQPWLAQTDLIEIDAEADFISDQGEEIWSILEKQQIENVILVGVHTNMCVLGRPFGLRRLATAGKNVVLARDLTDTMYDPRAWPYASHFTGTDLIISHIERYVCPTISSEQVLGGEAFRFADDQRIRLLMIIAEDEYLTEKTLPVYAAKHLSGDFSVSYAFGSESERERIVGLEQLEQADAVLISVRRRALPLEDMQRLKDFVASGKPVIGIRTASHAFSLRGQEPEDGLAVWPEFDPHVFGGNYTNHHGNRLQAQLRVLESAADHSILQAAQAGTLQPAGSLYKVSPLEAGAYPLLEGTVEGHPAEPLAWTFIRNDGGRSFYTSLGHEDDFAQAEFQSLLTGGVYWTCGRTPPDKRAIAEQNQRYSASSGRQRK